MINRSKRRSIIFITFNFNFFFLWRGDIDIDQQFRDMSSNAVPPPFPSLAPSPPHPLHPRAPPGSMKVETFERKTWASDSFIVSSLIPFRGNPNRIFSLSRSNDPLTNDFFFSPHPCLFTNVCMFSSISICLIIIIIIILESFLFFFFLFLSSLTSVASIDEIIEEEISPRSYCKRVQEDRLRGLIIIE